MESPGWKVYICVPRGLEWLSGCGTVSSSSVFLQVNGDPYSSKGEPCPFLANRLHVSSAAISWLLTASSFFSLISLFIYLFVCLFIFVFVAVRRLSLFVESGGYSSLRCTGFSLWWLLLLQSTGSRHAGFSSCGTQAQ